MKSLKKTLVLLVVFSMILATVAPAFAATDVADLDCEEQVTRLEALGVVTGYEDGTYGPEKTVTRAEMAVILCKMVGIDKVTVEENANVPSKFSDVKAGEWYTGYVNVAAGKGLLSGFPDGTFRPSEQLTMNQVLTLCVNALGRGEYVATMGTWPANYISEATKLGLLDDVKTSVANRGNVAIICWNTLTAPYVWEVTGTEYEGTINLGSKGNSLLSTYFRDYITTDGDLKEFTKSIIASEIDDSHLVLAANSILSNSNFDKKPKKNADTASYVDSSKYYIYVPETVCKDLEELKNREVTIILGEDNVAALIITEDDVVDTAFLTKYDDNKITVGNSTYKLASGYTVVLNDANVTGSDRLEAALTKIQSATGATIDFKDIEKKIEAKLTLNGDDKVSNIELFTSMNGENTAEALVTKVKETSSTYTITTTGDKITWSVDDEDDSDFDFPKTYIDGVKGDMKDIKAGDVITVIKGSSEDSDVKYGSTYIAKVYVSTKTKQGTVDRVKAKNNAIVIDGEVYTTSAMNDAKIMSTEELKDFDGKTFKDSDVDNEEVTLYLNIFGEYSKIILEEVDTDYTFGVVTFIDSQFTRSGDEKEIQEISMRLLLADNTKQYYTLTLDTSDEDTLEDLDVDNIDELELPIKGEFVMVEAVDKTVAIEDGNEILKLKATGAKNLSNVSKNLPGDYIRASWVANSVDKNGEEFTAVYGLSDTKIDAEYTPDVVIFNTAEQEIVSKWKSILADDEKNFAADTFIIFEDKDDEAPLYIVVSIDEDRYSSTAAQYAVVEKSADRKNDKYYVSFTDGESIQIKGTNKSDEVVAALTDIDNAFVEYKMASSKVSKAAMLLDTKKLDEKELDDKVSLTMIKDGFETILADKIYNLMRSAENYYVLTEAGETDAKYVIPKGMTAVGNTTSGKEVGKTVEKFGKYYKEDSAGTIDVVETGATGATQINYDDPALIDYKGEALYTSFITGKKVKVFVGYYEEDNVNGTIEVVNTGAGANQVEYDEVFDYKGDRLYTSFIPGKKVNIISDFYSVNDEGTYYVVPEATKDDTKCINDITSFHIGTVAVGTYVKEITGLNKDVYKEHFTVDTIKEYKDKDYYKVTYKDFNGEHTLDTLGSIKVDEDALIYDLRDGSCSVITWNELQKLVAEDILAIPFYNNDCADEADVNVLVILD